jgi:hypothetical protein
MAGTRTLRGRAQAPYEGAFPASVGAAQACEERAAATRRSAGMRKGVDL